MYRNMLSLTDRFIATGWPSSYSTPEAPPSPDRPSILARSSSSSWDWVFLGAGGVDGVVSGVVVCLEGAAGVAWGGWVLGVGAVEYGALWEVSISGSRGEGVFTLDDCDVGVVEKGVVKGCC